MEFQFYLTKEQIEEMDTLEYEAFERAQDGEFRMYRLRPAIARFMVDANNKPIPYAVALKQTEKLKVRHYEMFIKNFFEMMQNTAVPNGNGSPSQEPIEVKQMDSPSLVG